MMKNKKTYLIEETLIKNYSKYYRLAFAYVHNETDAMDIVQESAYKAILKSDSLKNCDYVDTWIYRIVINEAKNLLSKNKNIIEPLENITLKVEDKHSDIDLKNALQILQEPDKSIIILKYFEELKLEQISNILNINLNTVKSKLYRALKKLEIFMEVK